MPTASDFDKVATTLSEGLSSQLASLRAIVVDAEARRERDSLEIARLSDDLTRRAAELSDRTAELSERNDKIKSIQQTLPRAREHARPEVLAGAGHRPGLGPTYAAARRYNSPPSTDIR